MTKISKAKFIVFEGIDGAGCSTQSRLLYNFLKEKNLSVEKLRYPDYRSPIGKIVRQFLYKKHDFPTEIQFFLHFSDFLKDKDKIKNYQKNNKFIVSDRYFTSSLAYQCLDKSFLKKALKVASIFDLPKPDLIVYLDVSPKVSMERKYKEKKFLDRNEADEKFLRKVSGAYKYLIKKNIFGKWITINGERSIKKVFNDIKLKINI